MFILKSHASAILCALYVLTVPLFSSAAQAGQWKVTYKATGVGVANEDSSPWDPEQATQFTDKRDAPGVPNNTHASSSGSVTAYLNWIADRADDLPPKKIYVREFANVSSHAWCPAHGSQADLDDGFQDPKQTISDSFINKYFKSEGAHLTVVNNSSRASEVRVPTRHFEASGVNLCPNAAGGAHVDFTYRVEVIRFDLKVKRKGTTNFGSQATVAAGGKDPQEHLVDLQVVTTPALADVPIQVQIPVGGGGGKTNPVVTLDRATTDSNGTITGSFRSGDVIQPVMLELDTGQNTKVIVDQKWSDPDDPTRWNYDPHLRYDVANQVAFEPKIKDGSQWVLIKGHSIAFKVTRIKYLVWDPDLNNFKIKTSSDPADLASVASFGPDPVVTDNNTGKYQSFLTLIRTSKKLVEVRFDVEDQGVLSLW